jgi:putative transposase
MSMVRGRELVSVDHPHLSVVLQCELLGISRSGFYHAPVGESDANLALMRLIDEQFLETPFYGSRQMTRHLGRLGHCVGRHHVRRLMRQMGLAAVYQRPRTSVPHPEHAVFPYLLRGMLLERPNHVWCADITYVPMRRGFLYLVAVGAAYAFRHIGPLRGPMDWAGREVLAWCVSNTMEVEFCIAAVSEAIERFGAPGIFNTDQGSQFTSPRFVSLLQDAGIRGSMDGRGRWMDNVFIERLWRSLKYGCAYLHAYEMTSERRGGLTAWVGLYNERRPHSALAGQTPNEVYEKKPPSPAAGPACPPAGTQARQQATVAQAV